TPPLAVGLLQLSRGDIVGEGYRGDEVASIAARHLSSPPADHERDLALEVDPSGLGRNRDGLTRREHRRGWLEEEHRLAGELVAELASVGGVVPPDADNLPRSGAGHRRLA